MDAEVVALVVAALGLIGALVGGFLKLHKGVQKIDLNVDGNLTSLRRALYITLGGVFIVVLAAFASLLKGQVDGAEREKRREQ